MTRARRLTAEAVGTALLLAGVVGSGIMAEQLAQRWGTPVIVENVSGGSMVIGAAQAFRSPPDGYTLFVFSSGIALSKSLLKSMPFDPVTAFAPISTMAQFDLLLLVKADSPIRTLKEALDAARVDPQKFNVGTINPGSTQNVTGELLRYASGVPMTVVPHRTSAEVLTSLLRGDTQLAIDALAALKAAVDDKQIRAIASSGSKRSPQQPDVPTMRDLGYPNFKVETWYGIFAPAGTPAPIVAKLSVEIDSILREPDVRAQLARQGMNPIGGTPARLATYVKEDLARWKRVVEETGLKPE